MKQKMQARPENIQPFDPNADFENNLIKKKRKDSCTFLNQESSKPPIEKNTFEMVRRGSYKKENAKNPVAKIDQIIGCCEEALANYGQNSLARAPRSQSFNNSNVFKARRNVLEAVGKNDYNGDRKGEPIVEKCSLLNDRHRGDSFREKSVKSVARAYPQKKSVKMVGEIPGVNNTQLRRLYEARCADLERQATSGQERRFIEFCSKVIRERKFSLRESGLGTECCQVLLQILRNNYQFATIDLAENNIGEEGLESLCEMMKTNHSAVSLNLSSNNITTECGLMLFNSLKLHPTLTELNISNNDKLHKNRIGPKGCVGLRDFLQNNNILTVLNVAENAIGTEGLRYISEGLQGNKVLLSLNLSNNNLPPNCICLLTSSLLQSGVIELILRHNDLNDRSMDDLSWLIYKRDNIVERV